MGDLISRQKVIDKLKRLIEVERLQGTDEMGYGRERVSAYESMIYEVESEYLYPSVENKGEWIPQPSNKEQGERDFIWWKCSKCGQVIYSETEKDREEFHAFCGRCGADMRGE